MSELLYCQKEEITPIADALRELCNTDEQMSLVSMRARIGNVATEVQEQTDLICQIAEVYEATPSTEDSTMEGNTELLKGLLQLAENNVGNVTLPELSNEGSAGDLLKGKQLIDGDGNIVTGTFSIDSELSTQDDLISQIRAAVDSLPEAGGNVSVEWKNVFELPITYVATMSYVNYYIEMPETFNIFVVRVFRDNSWHYNIFSIRNGTNILDNSSASDGSISLDHINDGILTISFITSNNVPLATIAEYIII